MESKQIPIIMKKNIDQISNNYHQPKKENKTHTHEVDFGNLCKLNEYIFG